MKESVSLRFCQGSADKVYKVALEPKNDGWLVNFAYGRYGKALKHGTKTATELPLERAKKAYDKLVASKIAKGYSPEEGGVPFTGSQIEQDRTNLYPQLLNEVTREDVPGTLSRFGGSVAMQFKHDGERRLVEVTDTELYGANRRALKVPLTPQIEASLLLIQKHQPGGFIIDTEDMGDSLVVFDILRFGEKEVQDLPFEHRDRYLRIFEQFLWDLEIDNISVDIPRHYDDVKSILTDIDRAEAQGHEGVVLRDWLAPYSIGRPNSGGPCLKIKFWQSATCRVASIHPTKRSIGLELLDTTGWIPVGNCTIPTNYHMPAIFDLVEIKYMYAYRKGSIYQPQYKGLRADLKKEAATINQLKYKEDMT